MQDNNVIFRTTAGTETLGALLGMTRRQATFEVCQVDAVLRSSEVLKEFQILEKQRQLYSGNAVVQAVVSSGTSVICSVALEDGAFNASLSGSANGHGSAADQMAGLVADWQGHCRVKPEFKVAVADIRTFLTSLRHWLEHVEIGFALLTANERHRRENDFLDEVAPQAIGVIDELFGRFEHEAAKLPAEVRPFHRSYIQRELHPIVLCAPFAGRCYRKPLGYAGDYEMVNMMMRDPREGPSLFARLFNVWLLNQSSAAAHRNRVRHLVGRLGEEVARGLRQRRPTRVLNIGCGPTAEIQQFLAESAMSDSLEIVLLDFNQETLEHAVGALRRVCEAHHRRAAIQTVRRSVQQLLKDSLRSGAREDPPAFDFVYCAGLFDYMPDRTCTLLLKHMWQVTRPGGAVLATNVTPESPNRGSLELILDWHLIYRDAGQVRRLWPADLPQEEVRVFADPNTFANVWLETRKEVATDAR